MIEEDLCEDERINEESYKQDILDGQNTCGSQNKEAEVDQTARQLSRQIAENKRRDMQNPYFYDPNINFVNSNILFKNFFTQYKPQDRQANYQRIALQQHISHSQHGSNSQIQLNSTQNIKSKELIQKEVVQKQDSNKQKESDEQQRLEMLVVEGEGETQQTFVQPQGIEEEIRVQMKENGQNSKNEQVNASQKDIQQAIQKGKLQQGMEVEQLVNQVQSNQLQQGQQRLPAEQDETTKELQKKKIGFRVNKSNESINNMIELQQDLDIIYEKFYPSQTYINCDLKYFNFELIIQNTGQFEVVYMDPPWRIKGGQQFDSQFMFSNSKFSLDYDTMSNKEIMDIPVEKLSSKGFLFLWILNTQMNTAIEMMQKWGYNLVDKIVWVKMKDKNVYLSHGYYFMHSFELCLIGYKNENNEISDMYPASSYFQMVDEKKNIDETKARGGGYNKKGESDKSQYPQFFNKISNNVIFAEVRKKSQKPDDIYEIIDMIMPGAKKIELFARNNNLRPGWVSVGNQLGETYEKWKNQVVCDSCHQEITKGKLKRYKSRRCNNYDICEKCVENFDKNNFYEIQNKVNEDILHNYQSCNRCEAEPIWGIRFHCKVCKDYDLCEACIDENTQLDDCDQFHDLTHDMKIIEVPVFADGFPVHDRKCQSCFMSPIIGTCFTCKPCQGNFNLCQNCYFSKPMELMRNKRHKPEHQMDALISSIKSTKTKKNLYKCAGCGLINLVDMYKCESCYGFYFCIKCYDTKRDDFKTYMASSHKNYHSLIRYDLNQIEQQEVENQHKDLIPNQNLLQETDQNQDKDKIENNQIQKENNVLDGDLEPSPTQNGRNNESELNKKQQETNTDIDIEEDINQVTLVQNLQITPPLRLNKQGQPKRVYTRKLKKEVSKIKEDIQNENQIELEISEDNPFSNIHKQIEIINEAIDNAKRIQSSENKENSDQENDNNQNNDNLVPQIVKKIRKKRVSKKQIIAENQQQEQELLVEDIVEKNENLKEDVQNINEDIEQEQQNDDDDKSNDINEQENEDQKESIRKRKRRTKEEIERDRAEKERKEQEYLLGLQSGTVKKKRGRIPKSKDNNSLLQQNVSQINIQNELEIENDQEQQQENNNDYHKNNDSIFQKSLIKYAEKLVMDEMTLKSQELIDSHTISQQLTDNLNNQGFNQNQNQDENYSLKSRSDESSLVEKRVILDPKDSIIPLQSEYPLKLSQDINNNFRTQEFVDNTYLNPYNIIRTVINNFSSNQVQVNNTKESNHDSPSSLREEN